MDKLTRKELKTDHFVEEVGHGVEYVSSHKSLLVKAGIAAAVVLAVAIGAYAYLQSQKSSRMDLLNKAYLIHNTPAGPAQDGGPKPPYATEAERDLAASKAFSEVVTKYGSSDEGYIARYFIGTIDAKDAKWSEAERNLQDVANNAPSETASLAKFALAQVYAAQSKTAEAEKLLREIMDKPTEFVSKDQATLTLGRLLMKSKPDEAKKLLEPLRTASPAVSRAAVIALSGEESN